MSVPLANTELLLQSALPTERGNGPGAAAVVGAGPHRTTLSAARASFCPAIFQAGFHALTSFRGASGKSASESPGHPFPRSLTGSQAVTSLLKPQSGWHGATRRAEWNGLQDPWPLSLPRPHRDGFHWACVGSVGGDDGTTGSATVLSAEGVGVPTSPPDLRPGARRQTGCSGTGRRHRVSALVTWRLLFSSWSSSLSAPEKLGSNEDFSPRPPQCSRDRDMHAKYFKSFTKACRFPNTRRAEGGCGWQNYPLHAVIQRLSIPGRDAEEGPWLT